MTMTIFLNNRALYSQNIRCLNYIAMYSSGIGCASVHGCVYGLNCVSTAVNVLISKAE